MWWIGMVVSKSVEFDDYLVTFMTPSGLAKQYFWATKEDTCCIEKANIVCTLPTPSITSTSSRRAYSFSKSSLQKVEDMFNKFHKNK